MNRNTAGSDRRALGRRATWLMAIIVASIALGLVGASPVGARASVVTESAVGGSAGAANATPGPTGELNLFVLLGFVGFVAAVVALVGYRGRIANAATLRRFRAQLDMAPGIVAVFLADDRRVGDDL